MVLHCLNLLLEQTQKSTEPFTFIIACENKGISKTNTQTCSHWSSIKFPTFGMTHLFMSRSVFTPVCWLSVFINCICLMDYNYYFNCVLFMHTDRQRRARKAAWVLIKKREVMKNVSFAPRDPVSCLQECTIKHCDLYHLSIWINSAVKRA